MEYLLIKRYMIKTLLVSCEQNAERNSFCCLIVLIFQDYDNNYSCVLCSSTC